MDKVFSVKIIKQKGTSLPNFDSDMAKVSDWFIKHTPLTLAYDTEEVDFTPTYTSREIPSLQMTFKSIDDTSWLSLLEHVPFQKYNWTVCLYAHAPTEGGLFARGLSYRELMNDMCRTEICVNAPGTSQGEPLYQDLTHEVIHTFWTILHQFAEVSLDNDTMDTYYKDDEVEAPDGNRAQNLARIDSSEWNVIEVQGLRLTAINLIKAILAMLYKLVAEQKASASAPQDKYTVLYHTDAPSPQIKPDTLTLWAKAMQTFEGYYAPCTKYPFGTSSYRNNNPGNLRPGQFTKPFNYIKVSAGNFCVWKTYDDGFNALKGFLKNAASNVYITYYHSDMSLYEFFQVFAPSSENQPNIYANFVAAKLGVPITTKISTLI